jgi:hypothetical protein
VPTDRAQDTEAIRAALERARTAFGSRSYDRAATEALAALGRLVARLEAAEQALRYIAGYDVAGYDAHLRSEDVARAALAAAAPGECDGSPTCPAPEHDENCVAGWATGAAPGETEQTP